MATQDSSMEAHEIISESEESDPGTDWDDSEEDPDYEMHEEINKNFSNLSLKSKAKTRIVENKGLANEIEPKVLDMNAASNDDENFERVLKKIKEGLLEKLKVDECKVYLKKNNLRLTGNKETLIQRIKEHLEIINGVGEKKYPPDSFVMNCKGDACTGDVVLFEQNVYDMFNIASRSATGPPCGKRIVAGRIVKESYGAAKQQHTFTIEVLWSKGEKPLPPLHPLLIKGRNLYRLKTLRQKWEDEGKRQKMLLEKHSRGSVARAEREARMQEKERRKTMKENRISKKDSTKNQCQSRIAMSQHQFQEIDPSTNAKIPEFSSQQSAIYANTRKETSANAIVKKPAAVIDQCGKSIDSRTSAMGSDQFGNSGKPSVSANYNRNGFHATGSDQFRNSGKTSFDANYSYSGFHARENRTYTEKYHPFIVATSEFTDRTYHRQPLASANNHLHPLISNIESYNQKQLCRHFSRGRCYFGDNCRFLHVLSDKRECMN